MNTKEKPGLIFPFIELFSLLVYLHPLLGLVKAHEHVDDVEAGRRLVLLVNPAEKGTESLEAKG